MTQGIPISGARITPAETAAPTLASVIPREEAPSLAALPLTLGRGVCIWLTSAHPTLLAEIGPALCERLRAQRRDVELLPGPNGSAEGTPHRLDPTDTVGYLADTAGSLLRHGVTVVVAHPLAGSQDRALARDRIERMVEVFIRSAPTPLRGPEGIPVIYRWMSNGRVEERELTAPSLEPPDRPDVIVDGTLGAPEDVAGDILDVLERAGWIQDAVPATVSLPSSAGTAPTTVPLAATPAQARPP